MAEKRKLVALVTTEIFTPYKQGEVFCVPEEDAEKLLRVDRTKNDYGVPRYPKIKVRRFNPTLDGDLLLETGSLNLDDHNRLLSKLHPERPPIQVRMTQYESEITNLLDGIDPERNTEYEPNPKKTKVAPEDDNEEDEVSKAARGGGLRTRRNQQ